MLSLEKDSVVFSAFVNYSIMLCIEFSSLRFAFVSVNSIFGQMLLFFMRGFLFWSPILTLTPLKRVNFSEV